MAKIKGMYVGQIELNICHDEDEENLLPYDKIKENFKDLTWKLQKLLNRELTDSKDDKVKVTEVVSFVWKENDNENNLCLKCGADMRKGEEE